MKNCALIHPSWYSSGAKGPSGMSQPRKSSDGKFANRHQPIILPFGDSLSWSETQSKSNVSRVPALVLKTERLQESPVLNFFDQDTSPKAKENDGREAYSTQQQWGRGGVNASIVMEPLKGPPGNKSPMGSNTPLYVYVTSPGADIGTAWEISVVARVSAMTVPKANCCAMLRRDTPRRLAPKRSIVFHAGRNNLDRFILGSLIFLPIVFATIGIFPLFMMQLDAAGNLIKIKTH